MAGRSTDSLTQVLGARPHAGLAVLAPEDRDRLAATIEDARDKQVAAIARAEEDALAHIPWPLRGMARKLIGGNL